MEPLGMMRQCSVPIDRYECTVCIKGMYEVRASNERDCGLLFAT